MRFTVPYNNEDPDDFLQQMQPWSDPVESFYFGLPGILPTHNLAHGCAADFDRKCRNTFEFLRLIDGRFKSVLCLNTLTLPGEYGEIVFHVVREVKPLVHDLGLTAVNVASPMLAQIIRDAFPDLEIQTSCNTYAFLNRMYDWWHASFGTTVFNLPREAARTPWLLKDFRKTGYIAKCIVNEGCLYGCPGNVEHACQFLQPGFEKPMFCDSCHITLSDIFKTNFIAPHRLGEFEGLIDIVKLAGRTFKTRDIAYLLKSYVTRDPEADLLKIFAARLRNRLVKANLKMISKDWPKKTLTCECRECKTCNICDKAMEHVVRRSAAQG